MARDDRSVDGGRSRRFGTVAAASVGVPVPLFNQVFVLTPPDAEELAGAVTWMTGRRVPFWVTVAEPLVEAVTDAGDTIGVASSARTIPGMARSPLGDVPEPGGELEVVRVTEPGQLDDVAAVTAEAFGVPAEPARQLTPAAMLADEQMAWFLGRVDGRAVACGQLLRTGTVAGVYAVAVRTAFRRRGFGEAISWQVLGAGSQAGCDVGVLQASPLGRPVYERMGFEEVLPYHLFVPAGGG